MAIFNSYVKLPEGNVSLLGGIPHVCPRFGHICLSGLPLSCCQGDGIWLGGNTDPFTSYDLGILRVPIYIPGFRSKSIYCQCMTIWMENIMINRMNFEVPIFWDHRSAAALVPNFREHHASMQKSHLNMSCASAMSDILRDCYYEIFSEFLRFIQMTSFFLSLVVSPPQDPGDPF